MKNLSTSESLLVSMGFMVTLSGCSITSYMEPPIYPYSVEIGKAPAMEEHRTYAFSDLDRHRDMPALLGTAKATRHSGP